MSYFCSEFEERATDEVFGLDLGRKASPGAASSFSSAADDRASLNIQPWGINEW